MDGDVEYRLGADGRLIFSEFGADRRLNFAEIAAEVVDRGPRLAMLTDSGSGSVKFSLSPDHRRQLGVEVGDRVLVRSWLEVVPAVAALDPSAYPENFRCMAVTAFGGAPARWDLANGEWVPLQAMSRDGTPVACDPSDDVSAHFFDDVTRQMEVRWLDAATGRFAVRMTEGSGSRRVFAFYSQTCRTLILMDRTIEVFDSREGAGVAAAERLMRRIDRIMAEAPGGPEAIARDAIENGLVPREVMPDPEPKRGGYKYGGML